MATKAQKRAAGRIKHAKEEAERLQSGLRALATAEKARKHRSEALDESILEKPQNPVLRKAIPLSKADRKAQAREAAARRGAALAGQN